MTSSSIPAGSNGQPIFEELTFDDKDVNAKGPIKITIASAITGETLHIDKGLHAMGVGMKGIES